MKKEIIPVREKIVADFITPVSGYSRLGGGRYSFLLESAEKGKAGRFSFVGFCPRQVYELYPQGVRVLERKDGKLKESRKIKTLDPLGVIQKVQDRYTLKEGGDLPPFCGGLVGYAGYEIINTFENISFGSGGKGSFPSGVFMFCDEMVAFDHLHNTAEIIKLREKKTPEKRCLQRIQKIKEKLSSSATLNEIKLNKAGKADYRSNFSREEFKTSVRNIKKDIEDGQIIQGVLSQRLHARAPEDVFDCYRALRVINPSPYMFYLKLDDIILCGSSPEVMVKTWGSKASLKPIAGTRRRSEYGDEEKKLKEELQKDPKEIAEHIMLVDLGRNDLGRVCLPGSVKVKNLMEVEKYSHVMHMVTDIEGRLKKGTGSTDVFKACFPAGTVSGAPKLRAIKIIEREEKTPRGPYAGAVGYFSFTGDMDTCIAIRTMVVKGRDLFIQAGAGIVADSVPEREYRETMNKAGALLAALSMAQGKKGGEGD